MVWASVLSGAVVLLLLVRCLLLLQLCGSCVCSMVCCAVFCVLSSFAIILMGKRELVALFGLSYWGVL